MRKRINLGCGNDYMRGYINTDISTAVGADMVFDIKYGLPFRDDEVFEIVVNNVLTQIQSSKDFIFVMNELWRVCNKKGFIQIRVPNAKDICAWQDPMDCRRFTDQSFTYMQYNHRRYNQYGKHYGFMPFDVELLDNNGRQMTFKLCPKK